MKKIGFLFATVILIMLFAVSASALEPTGQCGDAVYWTFNEDTGELVISGSGDMYTYSASGSSPFDNKEVIKSVVIDSDVTSIGTFMFYDCSSLTSVFIGGSVEKIGSGIFTNCFALESIIVDSANATFSNDENGVLFNKDKTELIRYPIGNIETSYIVPDTVTTIGREAFESAENLRDITLPENLLLISACAFDNCNSLTNIVIPKNVTTIREYAFMDCDSITSITIPDNVTKIHNGAFRSCDKLTDVYIGRGLKPYGYHIFVGCTMLKNITVHEENKFFSNDIHGVLFDKNKTQLIQYPLGSEATLYIVPESVMVVGSYSFYSSQNLTDIIISDSVTNIEGDAFNNCDNLENITIGQNVKGIGCNAFYSCDKLTTVVIPDSVISFGEKYSYGGTTVTPSIPGVFYRCKNLKNVTIGEGVKEIQKTMFYNCSNLESITIPNSVTSIGENAFYSCRRLTDIYFNGTETQWKNIYIGSNNTPLANANIHFLIETGKCGDNAFYTIYNNGKLIISGTGAIKDYTDNWPAPWEEMKIVDVYISSGITRIGEQAFSGCYDMKYIDIPETVQEFGERSFAGCRNLSSIHISESVTLIEEGAFSFCNFEEISVDAQNPNYACDESGVLYSVNEKELILFPSASNLETYRVKEGTLSVAYSAFARANHLKTVVCPTSLNSIDDYAFYCCENLTKISLSENLVDIGDSAFAYCEKLEEIKFPKSLNGIGREAFNGCINLSGTIEVPSVDSYAFQNCKKIQKIIFRGSVISEYSFHMCSDLETVVISNKLKVVDICAFMFTGDIENVYYCGTEEQWRKIKFYGFSGDPLIESNMHYNCCFENSNYQHIHTSEITTEPTHITVGIKTFTCECGDTYTEEIEKLEGHTYETVVTAPTCTENGYITYTCACGESYVDNYTEKLDHKYTSKITTEPTHLTEGVESFTCKCGDTYTKSVPKLTTHTYKEVVTEPTHLTEGIKTYTCECGDTYTETIEKLKEHTYEKEVTAPTCTKQGFTTFTCACGETYIGDYVNEKGHSYFSNTVQPTCTKSGTVTTFCTSCGDTKTETIEATGHNFNGSKCTNCDYDKADECGCSCHKGGIAGFFFKLILFFQKIFRTNKTCSCGVAHY